MTTQTTITKRKTTKSLILEMENFLDYKRAQGIAELTMRDYTMLCLILDSGIRPCEMLRLLISNINFSDGIVIVTKLASKTRKQRCLPTSVVVLEAIEKLIKMRPKEWKSKFVFCTQDGEQMDVSALDKRFQIYSRKSGVKITPYDLRHTFGTMYVQDNGGNVFALQQMMGHSNLNMTKRYMSITAKQLKEQHDKATPLANIF